eukprot:Skav235529  [mRNA]  locus=scaffold3067:57196:58584:+ [translate_table: standard]
MALHVSEGATSNAPPHSGRNHDEAAETRPKGDYKSSWQRWQSMPGFLEQRRQQLLQKGQGHAERPQHPRPTQEALDFFESLLAGTEVEEDSSASNSTSSGAAQLQDAARRLQEQAEVLRSLRQHSSPRTQRDACASRPARASRPVRLDADPKDSSTHHKSFEESLEEREACAEARRLQHQRRLKEMEEAAALEQEQLQAEIEREQQDAAARRDAQQAWFEEFSQNTQRQKEAAEREARAKAASGFRERDHYWRTRWFRYVPKSEPNDADGGNKHPKPPNFRNFREKSRHSSGENWNREELDPGSTPEATILRELLSHRDEPVKSRKRIWRALCLRWHPDKSEGDKDLSTRVFQQLSELKPWFLPEA